MTGTIVIIIVVIIVVAAIVAGVMYQRRRRLQERFGTLIRIHQQNRRPPQSRNHQRHQERLGRVGQPRQTYFSAQPPEFVAGFFHCRTAADPRQQLGNDR